MNLEWDIGEGKDPEKQKMRRHQVKVSEYITSLLTKSRHVSLVA